MSYTWKFTHNSFFFGRATAIAKLSHIVAIACCRRERIRGGLPRHTRFSPSEERTVPLSGVFEAAAMEMDGVGGGPAELAERMEYASISDPISVYERVAGARKKVALPHLIGRGCGGVRFGFDMV
jgi:hypothetical protein